MATIGSDGFVSNPYARLGLAPGASMADVRTAYRRLVMHFHPDHAGTGSLQAFLALQTAYEWIVAHQSLAEPGLRRPGSVSRPTQAARSGWPGGRWYWEGIRARAARRTSPG
jgi:curved DNA-binding protein CbpA